MVLGATGVPEAVMMEVPTSMDEGGAVMVELVKAGNRVTVVALEVLVMIVVELRRVKEDGGAVRVEVMFAGSKEEKAVVFDEVEELEIEVVLDMVLVLALAAVATTVMRVVAVDGTEVMTSEVMTEVASCAWAKREEEVEE